MSEIKTTAVDDETTDFIKKCTKWRDEKISEQEKELVLLRKFKEVSMDSFNKIDDFISYECDGIRNADWIAFTDKLESDILNNKKKKK